MEPGCDFPEPTGFLDGECQDKATNSNEVLVVSRITQNDLVGLLEPGWDMKIITSLLAAVLLLAVVTASHATVRISGDRGGQIGNYVTKFERLRSSGESVVIDGLCASACTIVLGAIPHNKICVTSRATLGFHAAFDFGSNGRMITNPEATMMLYSMYPAPVQQWIAARGGLASQMIFLRGKQLQAIYQPCDLLRHESARS
jgi:hypothetical protein